MSAMGVAAWQRENTKPSDPVSLGPRDRKIANQLVLGKETVCNHAGRTYPADPSG